MNSYTRMPAQELGGHSINLRHRENFAAPLAGPQREAVKVIFWLQWGVATVLHLALLLGLSFAAMDAVPPLYRIVGIAAAAVSIPIYSVLNVYRVDEGYGLGLLRLFVAWCVLIMVLAGLAVIAEATHIFFGDVVQAWVFGGFALQALTFVPLHFWMKRWSVRLASRRYALIIGTGPLAQSLAVAMREPLVGMVEADESETTLQHSTDDGPFTFRCLGQVGDLRTLIKNHRISRVYIALPADYSDQVKDLYMDLLDANVDIIWVPDVAELLLVNHSISSVGNLPAVHLNESPLTSRPGSALLKNVMDRSLAILCLIVLSPLMLAVAIAVKMSSPGPVLFSQQRHGWNGSVINVLKFRSMRVHNDSQVVQATKNDSRVTAVGRFIRRTSIDELPQLFNVIKGEMSLVGPRPHAIVHNDYYAGKILAYMARHRIKPGITGHAQVNGYRGETDTLEKMARRVEMDLEYINTWSLWLDIKILLRTPLTLLSDNIY